MMLLEIESIVLSLLFPGRANLRSPNSNANVVQLETPLYKFEKVSLKQTFVLKGSNPYMLLSM